MIQPVELSLSSSEYELWRELIWQRSGLYFPEGRIRSLRQALEERRRFLQIKNYAEYYQRVVHSVEGAAEWKNLLDLLLNHETSFLRHQPSFEALSAYVLPQIIETRQKQGVEQLALWSAGCSSGQEAYSLAMAYLEYCAAVGFREALKPNLALQPGVSVFGSDISQRSLEKARAGRYRTHEVRFMPVHYRERYMARIEDGGATFYWVREEVRALLKFNTFNLSAPDGSWPAGQDVIFCQNVLIYFKPDSRKEAVERLCQRLNPGGYLFLSPAEIVGVKLAGMQQVRLADTLIYQRLD